MMNDAEAVQVSVEAYVLPAEVRDGVLRYLAARPYAEVHEGIQALLALTPIVNGIAEAEAS